MFPNYFPYHRQDFNGNINLAIFVNLLIYILILLTVPSLFVLLLSFIKPKLKPTSNFYLYAFSSAIFVLIGTVGLIGESLEHGREYISRLRSGNIRKVNEAIEAGLAIGITAGGALIGLTVVILFRFLFIKKFGEIHHTHEMHGHNDLITNVHDIDSKTIKAAWLVIFLILSHRMIDGFILGGATYRFTSRFTSDSNQELNIGFIITFNLHILVEAVIIYYRQIQYGQKRWKAVMYNFLTTLVIVPIMFLGAYINPYLQRLDWFLPVVNASGGAIITFVGIIEIVPEFIHFKDMQSKEWYKVIIAFALGIIVALILLSFHTHGHEHGEHGHSHSHGHAGHNHGHEHHFKQIAQSVFSLQSLRI